MAAGWLGQPRGLSEWNNQGFTVVNALARSVQGMGSTRILVLMGVAAVVIALLFFMATRLTQPSMGLLFADLSPNDSAKIVTKLEAMAVPYKLGGDGSQIFVPSDQTLRLRLSMAEEGLPRGGSIGYEVFDRSDTLGATRSILDINLLRALEGELARTIRSFRKIDAARVHLVIPKRALFSQDRIKPSASIIVTQFGIDPLTKAQVTAIQHLVAAAVPGLSPSRISIVDSNGVLFTRGTGDDEDGGMAPSASQDYRAAYEKRMKNMIEGILERSLGLGKVRAEVSAEIDFDRITTNSEIYDPDGAVARSTQFVEEETSNSESDGPRTVTVSNNLPDGEGEATFSTGNSNTTSRTEETTNYEISKTIRSHVQESGTVKRISVAVLIDGSYTTDESGERTYEPRSDDEMQQLTTLVRSAIGYDEDRGDTVELVNMKFNEPLAVEAGEAPMIDLGKGDYFKMAEIAALFIVGLLVVLLVLRPLAAFGLVTGAPAAVGEGGAELQAALPEPGQATARIEATPLQKSEAENLIDLSQVEGKVKQSTLRKVGEIIESHPDEALTIIRDWLYQQA